MKNPSFTYIDTKGQSIPEDIRPKQKHRTLFHLFRTALTSGMTELTITPQEGNFVAHASNPWTTSTTTLSHGEWEDIKKSLNTFSYYGPARYDVFRVGFIYFKTAVGQRTIRFQTTPTAYGVRVDFKLPHIQEKPLQGVTIPASLMDHLPATQPPKGMHVVIGLPGSGKTLFLHQLQEQLLSQTHTLTLTTGGLETNQRTPTTLLNSSEENLESHMLPHIKSWATNAIVADGLEDQKTLFALGEQGTPVYLAERSPSISHYLQSLAQTKPLSSLEGVLKTITRVQMVRNVKHPSAQRYLSIEEKRLYGLQTSSSFTVPDAPIDTTDNNPTFTMLFEQLHLNHALFQALENRSIRNILLHPGEDIHYSSMYHSAWDAITSGATTIEEVERFFPLSFS